MIRRLLLPLALLICVLPTCGSQQGNASGDLFGNANGQALLPPMSVSFWYNASASPSNASVQAIVTMTHGWFGFTWNHNNVSFQQACATSSNGSGFVSAKSTTTFSLNTWYNIACVETKSGTNCSVTVYVNGVSQVTSSTTTCSTNVGTCLSGGCLLQAFGYTGSGTGKIADVAWWNATLSAGEVAALATHASPTKIHSASLVFYTPLYGLSSEITAFSSSGYGSAAKQGTPTAVAGTMTTPASGAGH